MTAYDLELVPGRECGACTVCCTVMAIDKPEIQKEAGVRCRYCSAGCTIYEKRPALCRDYHCGWRQLPILDDSWRPDLSGVFVEFEPVGDTTGLSLILVGNPLKIVRQAWFIDFIVAGVQSNIPLSLAIPGPRGYQGATLLLNTREMLAATNISRAHVKEILESELKRLSTYQFVPRVIINKGHNFGVEPYPSQSKR